MRVVYLDHVARLSGGEIALVRALQAIGDRVDRHVILGEDGPLRGRLEEIGVTTEVLPLDPAARDLRKDTVGGARMGAAAPIRALAYSWKLRRRLAELGPDVVHTNSLKAALYGGLAGRLAGVPVVWHVRDRIATDYLPAPAVALVRTAARFLPAAVVANSHITAQTVAPSATVVPNAVIHDPVEAPEPGPGELCRPFRVALVGRLAPWKGQDVFLRAFAAAFGGDAGAEAWLVGSAMFGEDDYEASLRYLCRDLGIEAQVAFRGFREDVWDEIRNSDVLVHCSVTPEPFGQVVVEGMAAGVAVIASSVGGPAEVVTDGTDGLLVAPRDVDGLAAAMRKLRDDPDLRRRLAAAGVESAKRFSPEATATALLAVYERVRRSRPA